MIDAMQQGGQQVAAEAIIRAYKERVDQLQELTILLKALNEAQAKEANQRIAGMAADMEFKQSEIARLADMVRELGGEPFPEVADEPGEG